MNARGIRASEAIKLPKMPPIRKGPPIRASELVKRRHAKALTDFQREIERREELFIKLAKTHTKIWRLGRQVKRYEQLLGR